MVVFGDWVVVLINIFPNLKDMLLCNKTIYLVLSGAIPGQKNIKERQMYLIQVFCGSLQE